MKSHTELQKKDLQKVIPLEKPEPSKMPKFRLKIKNFERSMTSVHNEISRVVFDGPMASTPYVKSFTDFGFKIKKVKRLRSSQSMKHMAHGLAQGLVEN